MDSDTGEGDEMSATAVAAEAGGGAGAGIGSEARAADARRRALFVLLRAELAAARTRMLDAGCSSHAVSRLLDERISLLSADGPIDAEPHSTIGTGTRAESRTGSPQGHEPDDVQDLSDDPVECGGIG